MLGAPTPLPHEAEPVKPFGGRATAEDARETDVSPIASAHVPVVRGPNRIRADPWRFAVAPIFCMLSISNAMQWIAFAPIVDEVRDYFHMNAMQVNFLATTYVISYVAIIFLSCKLYEMTGIKMGVLVAALTNAIGASIKIVALYAWPNATLLYIAQVFNSFTEILTIATPPLIANRWFPEKERMVANTLLSSSLNFGCGVGVLIPTFFVGPEKASRGHFANLFWFHFGLCALMLLLVQFFFPRRPRYAASYAAERQQRREDQRVQAWASALSRRRASSTAEPTADADGVECKELHSDDEFSEEPEVQSVNVFSVLMDCLRELRRNPSFVALSIASAAELGLIWGTATVLPQALSPYGISEATSGWIGFLNLVLGTLVCPFLMPFVERNGRRYKLVLCTLAVILVVTMIALTLALHFGPEVTPDETYYVVVTFVLWGGVAGLCLNFMMPLMFEYVVELTFPMAESTSAPVLTWAACLANFLFTLIFGAVLTDTPDKDKSLRVFIGSTVSAFIGAVALFMAKPMHKRRDYEEQMKQKQLMAPPTSSCIEESADTMPPAA